MMKTNEGPSRREMIRWSALATGALAAACNGAPSAAPDASTAAVPLLNALLSAEWAAIAAYDAGAKVLSSPPRQDPMVSGAATFLAVAKHFQSQHVAHASALVSAIQALGGTPVEQSSVKFAAPPEFTGTVTNVLKLAANAEKAASIAYSATVPQLPVTNELRFLAGSILGDETQHFVVLYSILKGVAATGSNIDSGTSHIAPTDFASAVGGEAGLESVPDFPYS